MAKDPRKYQDGRLDFQNDDFISAAERNFVRAQMKELVNKMTDLRRKKNLSQEALAEATGLSLSTIRSIENQQRLPSLIVLAKLIYVLDRNSNIWD